MAIATNTVGAGGAVSIDNVTDSVTAAVIGSTVTAGGDVEVEALSDPQIYALALGFAFAPKFGLGGSVAINNVNDTTDAEVENNATTNSKIYAGGGDLTVQATDNPFIKVLTGGFAASSGQVAVSGSISDNYVGDTVDVTVSGATLTAPVGPIIIQGIASPSILAIAIAGSGAQGYTGNGAITLNSISSTMDVSVGDNTAVLKAPVVTINGADNSNIGAALYGVAGSGTASLVGSIATNTITGGMLVELQPPALSMPRSPRSARPMPRPSRS